MSDHEKVLELFLREQKDKIGELSQQVMILTTKCKMLEEELNEKSKKLNRLEIKLKEYEVINTKNRVKGFSHKTQVIR
jgi:phage shock protein A